MSPTPTRAPGPQPSVFTVGHCTISRFRKCDVLNRGFSGYNTRWARIILPRLVGNWDSPTVVTIFFGANDSSLRGKEVAVPAPAHLCP